jgi:hypothetical protein
MAEEAAMSRLYAGIHFRFDNEDGLALGRRIGELAAVSARPPPRSAEERLTARGTRSDRASGPRCACPCSASSSSPARGAGGGAVAARDATGAPARFRLHYTAQDREVGRYQYVPVRVAAGTTRLAVAYAYDKAGGANVVDLGLFEPGSLDLGTPAFRGWSGGAASEITVGTSAATPGYWPGPLPEGEWHVLLGLYKVGPAGVDITLTTETSSVPDPAPVPTLAPRPTGPLRSGPAWFSGGLHLHTRHSDGEFSTAEVCRRAREAGHDFVVITDHNNTTHQLDPVDVPGLLRIVGRGDHHPGRACERLRHRGLARPGGLPPHRRRRADPGPRPRRQRPGRAVRDQPPARGLPRLCLGAQRLRRSGGDGDHGRRSRGAHGHAGALGLAAPAAPPHRGLGSSDWHRADHPIGMASVRVWAAELSERAILDAMRAGRVVV